MDSKIDQIADFYQSQPKQEIMAGAPVNEIRLVMLGKTGTSKSSTGAALRLRYECESISSLSGSKNRFNKKVCVVRTPGLYETNIDHSEEISMEIQKCIALTSPGPPPITLTVHFDRFTEESGQTVYHCVSNGKIEQHYMFTKQDDIQEEWKKLFKYGYSSSINPLEPINENRFRKPFCAVITGDYQCFENINDQKEMKYPICLQSHGRHAVVQSQPIGRFTEEDEETVKYSQSYLGENLVGMILLIVTFLATIRKKEVQVMSTETANFWQKIGKPSLRILQAACSARSKDGPVRITKKNLGGENSKGTLPLREDQYYILMKSHGLAIDDFEKIMQHCSPGFPHADKTKLPVTTKIILDSMIISGGMEKDPNHVCKPEQKKCQMCIDRNEASYWCNTCRRNICNFCKLYHEKVWMVKNHNVQALF